ncbi:MAG: hypothetical protein IJ484_01330 [Oscillospiraceae bacterium]|nr:hypothetical protein [Oscillospiraceae bacterium]
MNWVYHSGKKGRKQEGTFDFSVFAEEENVACGETYCGLCKIAQKERKMFQKTKPSPCHIVCRQGDGLNAGPAISKSGFGGCDIMELLRPDGQGLKYRPEKAEND